MFLVVVGAMNQIGANRLNLGGRIFLREIRHAVVDLDAAEYDGAERLGISDGWGTPQIRHSADVDGTIAVAHPAAGVIEIVSLRHDGCRCEARWRVERRGG